MRLSGAGDVRGEKDPFAASEPMPRRKRFRIRDRKTRPRAALGLNRNVNLAISGLLSGSDATVPKEFANLGRIKKRKAALPALVTPRIWHGPNLTGQRYAWMN